MKYVFEVQQLEREFDAARTADALEAVLKKIVVLNAGFRDPKIYGRRLFCAGFDALVPHVARRLKLADVPGVKSNDNVCLVGTQFYRTGGHTRVGLDIMNRFPKGQRPVLVGTAIYAGDLQYVGLLEDPELNTGMGERACIIPMSPTLVGKTIELYMILKAMRPSRILLLNHAMDMVAILATWPFRSVVEFLHHTDHVPGLGATLPYSAHVDLTYTCHLACREAGLNPIYSGMSAVRPEGAVATREAGAPLRIATCGSLHKFEGARRFGWKDYAVAALRRPGAELVHIGPTTPGFEEGVREALGGAGIDPARYVFAGFVQNLGAELVRREVDVYLSSFPETGGKANLEAMAVGVPVILPLGADMPPLTRFRLPLEHWVEIDRPDELAAAFDRALELRATMRQPDGVAQLEQELRRFDDYVAGRLGSDIPAKAQPVDG